MSSLSHVSRDEKRRIAGEIHDNLVARSTNGPPDPILDPLIPTSATVRDALATQVDDKSAALAERSALLAECDVHDDEVDRWYRHGYRYIEVESLRRHAPEHAAIDALLMATYPNGLAHVDDRIPDQNEEVRKTMTALRNPEYAGILGAIGFPLQWVDLLETAVQKSDASFAKYRAAVGQASSAVAMGRDAEDDWVQWARRLSHAIALRSTGADVDVVEEGKRLIAPLTNAVRQLRTQAKTRATKKKQTTP
ncbi:MAG: hypothetical protein IPM54_35355 [Polyangiaceae bacterium]|nr:hypothetical protein [Polyangiaceae bacterium]